MNLSTYMPSNFNGKGPFINYVTHLGGGGGLRSCYDLLRRGEGGLAALLRNAKVYIRLTFYFTYLLLHVGFRYDLD